MAIKARHVLGDKSAGATSDGGDNVTIYSDKFSVRGAPNWSAHIVWTSTLEATVTLWASNFESPDPTSDTDWVQMTADHGWDGFPGGDPAGTAGKDFVDVSSSGALWYKFKVARTASSGTVRLIVTAKDSR